MVDLTTKKVAAKWSPIKNSHMTILINPNIEKDPIYKAIFNDEFRYIDKISASTDDRGGLQESKLSKTVLNTGEPREIEFIGRDRKKKL